MQARARAEKCAGMWAGDRSETVSADKPVLPELIRLGWSIWRSRVDNL